MQELCERLSLDTGRRIGELSSGNRRKVGIVQAVMHDPDVLLLDEPTSGLDPLVQREVHALLQSAATVVPGCCCPRTCCRRSRTSPTGWSCCGAWRTTGWSCSCRRLRPIASWTTCREWLSGRPRTHRVLVELDGPIGALLKHVAPLDVQRIRTHAQDLEDVFFAYYREDGR